jgi:hypothetical protein
VRALEVTGRARWEWEMLVVLLDEMVQGKANDYDIQVPDSASERRLCSIGSGLSSKKGDLHDFLHRGQHAEEGHQTDVARPGEVVYRARRSLTRVTIHVPSWARDIAVLEGPRQYAAEPHRHHHQNEGRRRVQSCAEPFAWVGLSMGPGRKADSASVLA